MTQSGNYGSYESVTPSQRCRHVSARSRRIIRWRLAAQPRHDSLALGELGSHRVQAEIATALRYVCGALIKFDTDRGGSPTDLPDIERLVSAVELLSKRNGLEVSPFIGSWDPVVDQLGHSTFPTNFDSNFKKEIISGRGHVKTLIQAAIRAEIGTGDTKIYGDLLLKLHQGLRQWVNIPHIEVFSYLEPSVRLGEREGGTTIVTLNYDLSIEGQAAAIGIPCDTGIRSWSVDGKLSWRIGSVNLLKLHGSIGGVFLRNILTMGNSKRAGCFRSDGTKPRRHLWEREKLRATGPFLQRFDEFRKRLDTANQLVVIGYSFQDDHVNEIIRRWINRDKLRHIIVIDPFFPTHQMGAAEDSDFRQELLGALVAREIPGAPPRLPDRMWVICKTASNGLADLGL